MKKPESNGLFEVAGSKQPKEQGFFCPRLMNYINMEDVPKCTPEYQSLWKDRFEKAKSGCCHYRDRCPVYERTMSKQKTKDRQMNIVFDP